MIKILIYLALLTIFSVSIVKSETIISKKDADHMFSMKKSEWEEFKFKYVFPDGWEARFVELDTGSSIMAFDKKNNIGLSVQPFYEDTNSLPDIVKVGSYYEKGRLNIDKSVLLPFCQARFKLEI